MTTNTLDAVAREKLETDLYDYLEKTTPDEDFSRDKYRDYVEGFGDDDLINFWRELVGPGIEEASTQEGTELHEYWEDAEVDGVMTPVDWQLERILNGEEVHYYIPTLVNVLKKALQQTETLWVSGEKMDFFLMMARMDTDDEGFIRDDETGEYKEPYAFDTHDSRSFKPFKELAYDSEDDPLEERLAQMREESERPELHYSDRVHVTNVGGIIHPGFLEGDKAQILRDSFGDMIDLMSAGALTRNLKAVSPESPVMVTTEKWDEYKPLADAVLGQDDNSEWEDPRTEEE